LNRRSWNWKEANLPSKLAEDLARRFEVEFYEAALAAEPASLDILVALGDLYAQEGLHEKGLQIDQRLVEIRPSEPKYFYNLACSHSLLGHIDPGLQALSRAFQLGYNKIEQLSADPDLENLKKDERFHRLLQEVSKKQRSEGKTARE